MTRLGILVATISKFLRELRRCYPTLHAQLDQEIISRFVERDGECFGFGKPSETKRQLPEVACVLGSLVNRFKETTAADLESYQLMARVFEEQCETVPGKTDFEKIQIKAPMMIPSDTVQNPSDPDASYNAHRGVGYLIQVAETYSRGDPSMMSKEQALDLITYIDVQKMTQHDSKAIEPAILELAGRDVRPDILLGDSHYGSTESIRRTAELSVEIVAPSMPPKGYKEGRLVLEDFELDESGIIIKCPAGDTPIKARLSKSKIEVLFDQLRCGRCCDRQRCPGYANRQGQTIRRWQYTLARVAQYRRRLAEKSVTFKEHYRWRAGVEATMSRLKHQMGLAKLRVRGKQSVKYAVYMRALGLNIQRSAACAR